MMDAMFPVAASEHAGDIDNMIDVVHYLMLALFVVWGVFFIYTLMRFRAGRNPKADYVGVKSKASTWGEVAVAIAEGILLLGFSIPMWAERVDEVPDESEATVVRVVAQQFAWNVWYPGADGEFGAADVNLVDEATNPIGLDRSDEHGADDIWTVNQLHLPVDQAAIIHLSSKDVIHSFNLPNMRIKQDAIPGLSIPVWFVPTKTTAQIREETGNPDYVYEIACAQLCGNSHYSMRGFLTVHTEEEFQAWLDEEASYLGDTGEDDFFNF
ncbi:MAG: cytochrome c oxidase subunit II [Acidobacteria bacterium]|nr:cytochrome c oxidase subunit II [Acidobacteriota bacterium]